MAIFQNLCETQDEMEYLERKHFLSLESVAFIVIVIVIVFAHVFLYELKMSGQNKQYSSSSFISENFYV